MEEIIKWMTGYFDRLAMPLRQIADVFNIKATDRTLLNTFARYGYCNGGITARVEAQRSVESKCN
jgi:hypothetical protein